jgi:hypothetical protein
MYLSARQLQDLLKSGGELVLPFGTRLTPAAQDLARSRKLEIRFDVTAKSPTQTSQIKSPEPVQAVAHAGAGSFFWWCSTRSGTAKAAIAMVSREAPLRSIEVQEDAGKTPVAVKSLISALRTNNARGGIFVLDHAGAATVMLNRSRHVRAIVGTSLASIEAGLRDISANVLLIEPGTHALMTLKNMIARFVRGGAAPSPELQHELLSLSEGGHS